MRHEIYARGLWRSSRTRFKLPLFTVPWENPAMILRSSWGLSAGEKGSPA
jgi:hypothetical protein